MRAFYDWSMRYLLSWRLLALCLGGVLLAGCEAAAREPAPPAQRAFYYWRALFQLSAEQRRAVRELGVARIYLHLFDVGWSEREAEPETIAPVTFAPGERAPDGIEIVPVVFVANQVFKQLPRAESAAFARRVWDQVRARAERLGFDPREVQLDCDWTETTRDPFFAFVAALRELARADRVALSATIRLHQVKYRERTGVPPVDRGMLMFYNMGRFSAASGDRAIFDPEAAGRYLGRVADYPLPLDVALPIWAWVLHVRDGGVHDLLQSADPAELETLPFLARIGRDRYRATRNAFWRGSLLREGDELKVEAIGPNEALTAARMIAPRLAAQSRTVSLFDLSERNVTRHGLDALAQVFAAVR